MGSLALNLNPVFADYPTTPGVPTGWSAWTGATPTRVGGQVSPYGLRVVGAAGAFAGIWQNGSPGLLAVRPGWYVLEADVTLDSGALTGAGLLFQARNEADSATQQSLLLSFATDKDITDAAPGAGTVGRTYRYRKLVQVTHADAARARFYVQAHNSDHGSTAAANAVIFHRAAVRAATSAEIAAQRADANATSALASIDTLQTAVASNTSAIAALETDLSADIAGLSATVSIQAAAIVAVEDTADEALARAQAIYGVRLNVNGYISGFGLSNDGAESAFDVVADRFRVWESGMASPEPMFEVVDGAAFVGGNRVRTESVVPNSIADVQTELKPASPTTFVNAENTETILELEVELVAGRPVFFFGSIRAWQGSGSRDAGLVLSLNIYRSAAPLAAVRSARLFEALNPNAAPTLTAAEKVFDFAQALFVPDATEDYILRLVLDNGVPGSPTVSMKEGAIGMLILRA